MLENLFNIYLAEIISAAFKSGDQARNRPRWMFPRVWENFRALCGLIRLANCRWMFAHIRNASIARLFTTWSFEVHPNCAPKNACLLACLQDGLKDSFAFEIRMGMSIDDDGPPVAAATVRPVKHPNTLLLDDWLRAQPAPRFGFGSAPTLHEWVRRRSATRGWLKSAPPSPWSAAPRCPCSPRRTEDL